MTGVRGATATPSDDGFYLPADDARHAQMWLPWPQERGLQSAIATLAHVILRYEPVSLVVAPGEEAAARAACGLVTIVPVKFSSLRLRDTGPSFLVDGKGGSAATDWHFSGWGNRRAAGDDASFAHELLGHAEVRRFRAPLTAESSAFIADGDGTVIALAETVFDPSRNSSLTRLDAFAILQRWLGASRVIWLEHDLPADVFCTDVRALAAFLSPGVVALTSVGDDHPFADALRRARAGLSTAKDAAGRGLKVIELRAPPPVFRDGQPLILSYTNFLAINGAVLVPMFGAPTDESAMDVLARAFPGRDIVPVPALELAVHGVSLTSAAIPQPARLLQRDRATTLPRSAWTQSSPGAEDLLQKYIDMAGTP